MKKLLATLMFATVSLTVFAGKALQIQVGNTTVSGGDNLDSGLNTTTTGLMGGILQFLPLIQIAVIVVGAIMFGVMPFMQMRGQQLDPTELIKNGVILAIIVGAAFFGPNLLVNSAKNLGAEVNETAIVTETNSTNVIQNSNLALEK